MSSEACAVVREFCGAAIADDLQRLSDTLDPEVTFLGTRGGLDEHQVLVGPKAVLDYLAEIADPWERLEYEAERLIDAGDVVVVFWRETARAHRGGLELHSDTATIFKVRQGKIVQATGYLDRDEALEAAGLPGS